MVEGREVRGREGGKVWRPGEWWVRDSRRSCEGREGGDQGG